MIPLVYTSSETVPLPPLQSYHLYKLLATSLVY